MDVKKFVINLDRRKDRYETFLKNCPYKDVERISAFDGMYPLLNKNVDFYNFIKDAFPKLYSGEYGCWVSHLKVWKKIIDDNIPYAIIFEDDPIFCENFKQKCDKLLNENIDKIDTILYLGGVEKPDFIIEKAININENLIKFDYNAKWKLNFNFGTFSYLITKDLCKYFMNCLMLKIKGKRNAVDCFMLNMLQFKKLDIYCSKPFLSHSIIASENSDISPIQNWSYQPGGPSFPLELLNYDKKFELNPLLMKYTIDLNSNKVITPITEDIQDLFILNNNGENVKMFNSIVNKQLKWKQKEQLRRERMNQLKYDLSY